MPKYINEKCEFKIVCLICDKCKLEYRYLLGKLKYIIWFVDYLMREQLKV